MFLQIGVSTTRRCPQSVLERLLTTVVAMTVNAGSCRSDSRGESARRTRSSVGGGGGQREGTPCHGEGPGRASQVVQATGVGVCFLFRPAGARPPSFSLPSGPACLHSILQRGKTGASPQHLCIWFLSVGQDSVDWRAGRFLREKSDTYSSRCRRKTLVTSSAP